SLDWYAKAIAALEPIVRTEPQFVAARQNLLYARLGRGLALAQLGDHARAAAEADDVAQAKDVTAGTFYNLACLHAQVSAAASKDASLPQAERDPLAERHSLRAIELLARAQADGYFKAPARVAYLKKDPDLDPMRSRDDFKRLVGDFAKSLGK